MTYIIIEFIKKKIRLKPFKMISSLVFNFIFFFNKFFIY